MSIVRMHKASLCGPLGDKRRILEQLQRLGCLHLIPLQTPPPREPESVPSEHAEDAYRALHYLKDIRVGRRQIMESRLFDFDWVVQQALTNKQLRRETEDQRDFIVQRIEELMPWGNFVLPDKDELDGHLLWFYQLALNQLHRLEGFALPWQEVHRDNRFSYIVVISREEPPPDALPVARTHTGAVALEELRRELLLLEIKLEELISEHETLSRWVFLLSQNLARAEDRSSLEHASAQALEQEGFFVVQGWLPDKDMKRVSAFAEREGLALLAEEPQADERPPTLLENPPQFSGGQDLVGFYQTPAYRSWDPSVVVFFSFTLFFAMILADAGYALVLGGIIAWYWKRMGQGVTGSRLRVLALWVIGASFVYGVMVGSYLGLTPAAGTLADRLHVLRIDDFDGMMRLSIFIGCLHLALANAVVAYNARGFPANASPLGWIAVIFGGLSLWLGKAPGGSEALYALGVVLVAGGVTLIGLFSSTRRIDSLKSGLLRILDALAALTGVTRIFGDVLSYLRLFALGLASASLALTFNRLGANVQEAMPGMGLLLSILILVIGHSMNLGLAIISGFVHGLRLNFIEFFNWGLPDEGYPFRAFAKKEIET
jgi:V/A-type H+-transporting ATPase subunit I